MHRLSGARTGQNTVWALFAMTLPFWTACNGSGAGVTPGTDHGTGNNGALLDPNGAEVKSTTPIPAELRAELAEAATSSEASLVRQYPAPRATGPGYEATEAQGLDLIQNSNLALSEDELSTLTREGVVISSAREFPSFAYGYKAIYGDDLPLFVSADSILEAVHRTFDSLLQRVETLVLVPELEALLDTMLSKIGDSISDASVRKDAQVYLTVARALLTGAAPTGDGSAEAQEIAELFSLAQAGEGHRTVTLFGVERDEDFSQFTPRGHYTDTPTLERYFRAMMWLGRVDFRIIETQGDGSQVFHRQQFEVARAVTDLIMASGREQFELIDSTIGAFVGEHDNMTPGDMGLLLKDLDNKASSELSDDEITQKLTVGGYGEQRIASRIIIKGDSGDAPLPLDRSFAVFGQRYTVDSHTFSNTTFDRVKGRMLPDPLDAAFAALGNNSALFPLHLELQNGSFAQGLAKTRVLVDAHESSYWEGSLYTRWLGALRTLSPTETETVAGVSVTPGWNARILSTQLASWAEARHDTILYAKQSYTGGISCEFPDAYVDPYPEFYAELRKYAEAVGQLVATFPSSADTIKEPVQKWVELFDGVAANLELMAENQASGAAHSEELLSFINDAVTWDEQQLCGDVIRSNMSGWYLRLYEGLADAFEFDPTVADVHTQPTDEAGNDLGRILHVGTGRPRLMVMTANTCTGPRAYAGLAYSYAEFTKDNWQRMNDEEWATAIDTNGSFPDPEWMSVVLSK